MTEEQQMEFLFNEAKLGIKVEEWLATDVGRYVKGRAIIELEDIAAELLQVPSWQSQTAFGLQQKAQSLQMLMKWLDEAINNGKTSEAQLQDIEN